METDAEKARLLIPDDLTIPDFLRVENRTGGSTPVVAHVRASQDEIDKRQAEFRAIYAARKREKNAAALARLKEQHEGQRYNRKLKQWEPL